MSIHFFDRGVYYCDSQLVHSTEASVNTASLATLGLTSPFKVKLQSVGPQPSLQDSKGKSIGPMLDYNHVLLDVATLPALIRIGVNYYGFFSDRCGDANRVCNDPIFYFVSPGCTGPKYLRSDSLVTEGQVTPSNTVVYPASRGNTQTILSTEIDYGRSGSRCKSTNFQAVVAPLKSVPADSLGLTSP